MRAQLTITTNIIIIIIIITIRTLSQLQILVDFSLTTSAQSMVVTSGTFASSTKKGLITVRLRATQPLPHQQKSQTITLPTNKHTTKPTMTITCPPVLMMTTSNPSHHRMNRFLRSSLRVYQKLRMTFIFSKITYSTPEVQNRSLRFCVFQKVLLNINVLNPFLPYHHRAYITIMGTLPFPKIFSLYSAPTSGWKM